MVKASHLGIVFLLSWSYLSLEGYSLGLGTYFVVPSLLLCLSLYQYLIPFTRTRGQSNLTKSASRGAHSPVRGHPRGSKVAPLNSWGRVSY